jgi:hypothetical protein
MKTVFEASTSIEAHMVLNLLEQEGVQGVVQGEYLQGGAGELQATNLVRVEVPDEKYDIAKKVIQEWESLQVDSNADIKDEKTRSTGFLKFITGVLIGIGVTYWGFNSGVSNNGIDYDGDSILDERWIYNNDRHRKTEVDRNRDGKVDLIYYFSYQGSVDNIEQDDDFDGVFETKTKYYKGNPARQTTDSDNDGKVDYRAYYRNGVFTHAEISNGSPNSPIKKQYFKLNKLISSKHDTNSDGTYNKVIEYDFFEDPR